MSEVASAEIIVLSAVERQLCVKTPYVYKQNF